MVGKNSIIPIIRKSTVAVGIMMMCSVNGSHAAGEAGSVRVIFGGVVSKPTRVDAVQTHPQVLVSFGSQVMLPIDPLVLGSGDVRVFNATGQEISGTSMVYVQNGEKRLPARVVDLADREEQIFIVCAGNNTNCIRYRVTRR